MLLGQLPDQEGGEADHGDDRQPDDQPGLEPVVLLAEVEHQLQRADEDDQQREADEVDRRSFEPGLEALQHAPGERAPS